MVVGPVLYLPTDDALQGLCLLFSEYWPRRLPWKKVLGWQLGFPQAERPCR